MFRSIVLKFLFLTLFLAFSGVAYSTQSPHCTQTQIPLGGFCIELNKANNSIEIYDGLKGGSSIFSTWGDSPIQAKKVDSEFEYDRGSFLVKEDLLQTCRMERFDYVEKPSAEEIKLTGAFDQTCQPGLKFNIRLSPSEFGHLNLDISLDGGDGDWRVFISYRSPEHERLVGFGEQYTHFNMKGKRLPILSQEQGHGRGQQPLTSLLDLAGHSQGDWHTTYASIPHYISSLGRSLYLRNKEYSVFDMTAKDYVAIEVDSTHLAVSLLGKGNPKELIRSYTKYSGRMSPLPSWTQKGAIVCLMGGEQKVRANLQSLIEGEVPIAGVWIQDWVGSRDTFFGTRMNWNWQADPDSYRNLPGLIQEINTLGIEVLGYINPYLSETSESIWE